MSVALNEGVLQELAEWICDRHQIYRRKTDDLPPPWTTNQILREWKYCNVFRELDRGSQYAIKKIIPSLATKSLADAVFALLCYRIFNRIETYETLLAKEVSLEVCAYRPETLVAALDEQQSPIFTSAFTVCPMNFGRYKTFPTKLERVAAAMKDWCVALPTISSTIDDKKISQCTFQALRELPGLGEFNAYQVCLDIGYCRPDLFDEDRFVVAGPGAKRGVDLCYDHRGGMSYSEAIAHLRDTMNVRLASMTDLFDDRPSNKPILNLAATQNCMCELSKYVRCKRGGRGGKVKYDGVGGGGPPPAKEAKVAKVESWGGVH